MGFCWVGEGIGVVLGIGSKYHGNCHLSLSFSLSLSPSGGFVLETVKKCLEQNQIRKDEDMTLSFSPSLSL